MTQTNHQGGCLCGAVRYRAEGEPLQVEYCHCSMCRKAGGAPVVVWADFPTDAVTWTQGKPMEYASSPEALRGFCGNCGASLLFRRKVDPGWISLTVGTMDEPESFAPRQHIFHDDRLSWLDLGDDLPRHGPPVSP